MDRSSNDNFSKYSTDRYVVNKIFINVHKEVNKPKGSDFSSCLSKIGFLLQGPELLNIPHLRNNYLFHSSEEACTSCISNGPIILFTEDTDVISHALIAFERSIRSLKRSL